jgi:hypothetical protein
VKFDVDGAFADLIFLDKHPGWTYRDLADAPDEIVAGLRFLDSKRA